MLALRERLAAPWLVPLAVALGVALALPALSSGLATEDHVHAEAIRRGVVSWPWKVNLFAYSDGDVGAVYAQKDLGSIPWLAHEAYRVSFWRPLASWTHLFDHGVLGGTPWLLHAHSLAWFAALIAAVGALLRRLVDPPWVAGLAVLLFAVDDGHGQAVGWIANRNALIAAALAVLALLAHDRWRRDESPAFALVSAVLLALGLLAGELAVGVVGYLVAYAAFVDSGARWHRVRTLAPSLAVTAAWAVAYRALGHGTDGSGLYVDPLREPVAFLREAAWRVPALGTSLLGWPSADAWNGFDASTRRGAGAAFVVVVAVLAAVAAPVVRTRSRASFWVAGAALSALPALATFPSDRLLLLPSIGAAAVVAAVVGVALEPGAAGRARRAALGVASVALLGLHGPVAALRLPTRVRTMESVASGVERAVSSALVGHGDPGRMLVLVNAPSFYVGSLVVGVPLARGQGVPRHTRVLFGGGVPVTLERLDERTLLLRAEAGFFTDPIDRVYRGRRHPFRPGDGLMLTSMLAIVRETTPDGSPRAVTFQFGLPLEDPGLRLLEWVDGEYRPLDLPAIGRTRTLPPAFLRP